MPALLGLFSFCERRLSFLLLILLFFVPGSLLWNGYMDGYLSIYAGLAALFALDWLESGNRIDLIAGVAFLAVVSSLKNEGLVLAGVIVLCLLPVIWRKFCSRQPGRVKLGSLFQAGLCLLMVFGVALLWVWLRQRHGFVNDLSFSSKSLEIIGSRIAETESLLTVARLMLTASGLWQAIVVAVITGILCRVVCRNLCPAVLIALSMASIYSMILVMVYLATPYDLVWHLLSSAPRTTLPVIFLLGISIYRLMRQIEYVDPTTRSLE